eukprot:1360884-Amphidinium_carterae.1
MAFFKFSYYRIIHQQHFRFHRHNAEQPRPLHCIAMTTAFSLHSTTRMDAARPAQHAVTYLHVLGECRYHKLLLRAHTERTREWSAPVHVS